MKCIATLFLCAICALPKQPGPDSPVHLDVWVVNSAGIPERTLSAAQTIAAGLFRRAGIEVSWLDCLSPAKICRAERRSSHVWLQLLRHRPPLLEHDTAGYALLVPNCMNDCSYAAVSWPALQSAAESLHAQTSPLLGLTMVHELAHVLLGPHSHSHAGIMKPKLGIHELRWFDQGDLWFDEQQALRMRRMLTDPGTDASLRKLGSGRSRTYVHTDPSWFVLLHQL